MTGNASKHINSLRIIEVEGRCPAWGSGGSEKYKEKIREAAKKEMSSPYKVPVTIEIDLFYNSRMGNPVPAIDNAQKLIFDSLKGVALVDDKSVESAYPKVHDTSEIMIFDGPLFLTDMLMKGNISYTVIRIYEQ